MNPCRVAVGSTRRPKLQAVHEAATGFAALLSPHAPLEIEGHEVESGVSHTPISREELMQGARQRAEALEGLFRGSAKHADYFVGLEGGLNVASENGWRRVFLESGPTLPTVPAGTSAAPAASKYQKPSRRKF